MTTTTTTTTFKLIEDGQSHEINASVDATSVRLDTTKALEALGWTQKPEGLCQGDVCVPVASNPDLITDQGIHLEGLAELLGRPLAINREHAVASLGAAAESHGAQLTGGEAPDFTLPDLAGNEHTLSSFRGKKVLLIAYASW